MNLKKFISGISALTIAASAFAGMAVTASAAAALTQDFTSVSDSTDPADYGFTLSYGAGSSSTLVNYSVADGVLKCAAGPYASASDGARTGTATATFNAIGVGNEVTLSYVWKLGYATGNATGSYTKTSIGNSEGNALELAFYGSGTEDSGGSSGQGRFTVNGVSVLNKDLRTLRDATYTVNATLDMNTCKITSLVLDCSANAGDYSTTNLAFQSNIASLDRFAFTNSERQNYTNTSSIDDLSVTYEEAKVAVSSINVLYKNNGQTVKTVPVSADGLYVGDEYTYYSNNYILSDNGKWYYVAADETANATYDNKSPRTGLRNSLSLVANTEITYNVQPVDTSTNGSIVYYAEGEDITGFTESTRDAATNYPQLARYILSGGKVGKSNGTKSIFDVQENGIYQITIAMANTEAKTYGSKLYKNANIDDDNLIGSPMVSNAANGYVYVYSNVVLSDSDDLTLVGQRANGDNAMLDYIVVKKLTNTVNVANTTNGTVTSNVEYAKPGDTVTLTVTPDANYELDAISGVDATKVNDTTYTFTMPAEAVTVSATFNSTVVEPSVSISEVDSKAITYDNAPYTAAKLLVNVVGTVSGIRVYYGTAYKDATDMTAITNGTIVLGAIVDGNVNVTTSTFDVAVAE